MPPRILVLSASVGAGHLRAAEAVELALRQTVPDAHVQNLDVLELTNRLFRRVYGKLRVTLCVRRRNANRSADDGLCDAERTAPSFPRWLYGISGSKRCRTTLRHPRFRRRVVRQRRQHRQQYLE